MKDIKLIKRTKGKSITGGFADFFLYAPEEKMQKVFKEAARRANADQRKLFIKYGTKASAI